MRLDVSLVCLLATAGCAASDPAAPCASSPLGVPGCMARAICGFEIRCGALRPADAEVCVARVAETYERQARRLAAFVDAGATRFDAGTFDRCLDRFGEFSCHADREAQRRAEAACQRAFQGTKADGASCTDAAECVGGVCDGIGCSATCSTLPGEGEDCLWNCAPGLACDPLDGVCTRPATEREACDWSRPCEPGLSCVEADSGRRTCRAPLPDGQPCTFPAGVPCEHACRFPSGGDVGICGPLLAEGDSCTLPGEWVSSNRCGPGLACWPDTGGAEGTCRAAPGDGDACNSDDPPCRWPYRCLAATHICGLGPAVGEACAPAIDGYPTPDHCGEGTCVNGVCADASAPVPHGGVCETNLACEVGLGCRLGHCLACE